MLPGLTVLLLTEDSGRDAHATHAALLRAMLRLVAPDHDASRVRIDPADDAQRAAMRGNAWDSTDPSRQFDQRALVRSLATRVCMSNLHVVAFHYDGDRPWSDRARCPRHAKFEDKILTPIRQLLATTRNETQQSKALARIVTVVPFYSVEAWLYQNTAVARRLCVERCGGRDLALLDAWESDRTALDELTMPKERTALSDRFNLALATEAFPAEAVHRARRSFHDAVESLRGCDDLRNALLALTP